jgi:hypothetical protein
MKALIKIIITAVILVACFNASRAAFADYQFTDTVHEALLFDSRATDADVVDMIVKLAAQHEIPMEADDIKLRWIGQELRVDMTYTTTIVLVPGVYERDWTFNPTTSVRRLAGSAR